MLIAAAAGLVVAVASFLPFIRYNVPLPGGDIKEAVRVVSFLFGLGLVAGAALGLSPRWRHQACVLNGCVAGVGALGYSWLALHVGKQESLGGLVQASPGIGLILSILGCLVCAVASFAAVSFAAKGK